MKKIASLLVFISLISGSHLYAQAEMDAYKYSNNDLHGTARFSSMAGAFGALGGDISSMTTNPAGLGIYRSSEVVTTLDLSSIKTATNWSGSKFDQSKTKFNFDNIAYVGYFPTGNYSGIKGWNVGFAYNRVKNFARNYRVNGKQLYSVGDYIAEVTNLYADNNSAYTGNNLFDEEGQPNPYNKYNNLSVLGYNSSIIQAYDPNIAGGFYNVFGDEEGLWPVENTNMEVVEKGAIDQYDFALATNISDVVFLGATFIVTDLDYTYRSFYTEDFGYGDVLGLNNALTTEGNGYAFNVGAIVRPIDYLRLGVAYNSPTWYKLTDHFSANASSVIGDGEIKASVWGNQDYKLKTNDRWIFSAAGILGQYGLISVDYELNNYKGVRLSDRDGFDSDYDEINSYIKQDFKTSGTFRIGAEAKITPQFAVRLGGAWASSPISAEVKNGTIEVGTAGTIPHYTVDRGTSHYTIGLGYRFTPHFYADLACVYKEYKEDVYAFSNVFGVDKIASTPAEMKTKTTRIALTLGYKF